MKESLWRWLGRAALTSSVVLVLASSSVAAEPAPRLELGPIVGILLPGGRPGLRASYFFGGHLDTVLAGRLWLETEVGMAPTSTTADRTFTVNLFWGHAGLKVDVVRQPSGPSAIVPFMTAGVSFLDFDPAGVVDAEDDLRRWSVDWGGGLTVPVRRRIGLQVMTRFSVMMTHVERFPVSRHQGDSRASLHSFLGSALVVRL